MTIPHIIINSYFKLAYDYSLPSTSNCRAYSEVPLPPSYITIEDLQEDPPQRGSFPYINPHIQLVIQNPVLSYHRITLANSHHLVVIINIHRMRTSQSLLLILSYITVIVGESSMCGKFPLE